MIVLRVLLLSFPPLSAASPAVCARPRVKKMLLTARVRAYLRPIARSLLRAFFSHRSQADITLLCAGALSFPFEIDQNPLLCNSNALLRRGGSSRGYLTEGLVLRMPCQNSTSEMNFSAQQQVKATRARSRARSNRERATACLCVKGDPRETSRPPVSVINGHSRTSRCITLLSNNTSLLGIKIMSKSIILKRLQGVDGDRNKGLQLQARTRKDS